MSLLSDLRARVADLTRSDPDLSEDEARRRGRIFMRTVATPALQRVREELARAGYDPELSHGDGEDDVTLTVPREHGDPFRFSVRAEIYHKIGFAFPAFHGKKQRPRHVRIELTSPTRVRRYRPSGLDQDKLAALCRESACKWLTW